MSFSWVALRRIRRLAPDLALVYPRRTRRAWCAVTAVLRADWIAGPASSWCASTPSWSARIREAGTEVHVWVVNTREDLDLCLELGVEAVITDTPGDAGPT